MNLSHLYYFKKLVEVQHYTRAAQELFIAQPTLSAAIAHLEKELGAPLFVKHTRAVKLTPYGQDFYRYVDLALQNLDTGISLVEQRAGVRRSTVRVGTIYAVQDLDWAQAIKEFRATEEQATTIEVGQDRTPLLLAGLREGRYDAVFTGLPADEPGVVSVPWRAFDLVLAVNRNHPLAARRSISLAQLQPYHILSYTPSSPVYRTPGALQNIFERNGLDPDLSYSDTLAMCSLVAVDPDNIALVVDSYILRAFDDLVYLRLEGVPQGFHQTYLCTMDDDRAPDVVRRFAEYFRRNAPSALEHVVSPAAASAL